MKTRIIYALLSALFMWLYWLTFTGAMLFVFILAAFLFAYLVSSRLRNQYNRYLGIAGIVVAGIFTALIFTDRIAPRAFSGATVAATSELMPFNLVIAWQNFGFITFLVPIILGLLIYYAIKRGEAPLILLLVWSLMIMVATIMYWRFAYYFAVNAALLSGWLVWYVWQRLKPSLPKALALTAILCVLIIVPNVHIATANYKYRTPSDAWCEALTWVKENTFERALILAWWDYGYWIQRIADREAYANGGIPPDRVEEIAKMFLAPHNSRLIDADYLILDNATMSDMLYGITTWAGVPMGYYYDNYESSLMYMLYSGVYVWPYELVYSSEQEINGIAEVKIFRKRRVIDGQ